MNTPEQIAESVATKVEEWLWNKPPSNDSELYRNIIQLVLRIVVKATQPLHQRLIAAEVQVGKMREALKLCGEALAYPENGARYCRWCGKEHVTEGHTEHCYYVSKCQEITRARETFKALDNSPHPRTYEVFTAMVKALEGSTEALKHCYDVTEWPADGTSDQDAAIRVNEAAIKQAKEVGVV